MPVELTRVQQLCDALKIVRTADFADAGVSRHSLAVAVRAGVVLRVREGVFVPADALPEVRTAAAHGGVLGCISRLRLAGLWMLDDDEGSIHVVLPRNGHRRRHHGECTCVMHWGGAAVRGDRTSLVDALGCLLSCRGEESFFVALESALRKRLITRTGLARLRDLVPLKWRWLVDFARWDADSGLESLLRLRLRALGISLASQVVIPGVGRVDFVLGDRLILEVDGRLNHEGESMRHKDLVRDAVAASLGLDTLRFDYAMVVHEWPLVEAAILARIDRGLHLDRRVGGRSR
jgi:very-short-patch-repair endonuclease